MPLMFKKNGTTYQGFPPCSSREDDYTRFEAEEWKSKHTGSNMVNLCYRKDGNTYYAPCLRYTNQYCTTGKFRFTYDSSLPTLAVRKNNVTYHLANVRKYEYVKAEGNITSVTYSRSKQSNGFYKYTFTIKYYVKASVHPVGVNNGTYKIELMFAPDDLTYTTSWGGTRTGTLTPSDTSKSSTKTTTCSITATGGDVSTKDRWFAFMIHSNEIDINWDVAEIKTTEAWGDGYSIPAGTYTPSAFKNLIAGFISLNGSRKCANAFTVKVNNQTLSVSSGTTIYYKQQGSSPGEAVFVGFGNVTTDASSVASSFTNTKTYVVGRGVVGTYATVFSNYANYSITVTTGINFQ